MATIADELNAISVEHGYTGAAPKTIAGAIDALADTLAGTDVEGKRTIAGAVKALAPYIGSGGGGTRVELFNETVTVTKDGSDFYSAELAYTGAITDDPLHVVFNGVEYELPKANYGYGADGETGPDFSTYPLYINVDDDDAWVVLTKDAGTHTIIAYTNGSGGGGTTLGELAFVGAMGSESISIYVSTTPYDITSGETSSDIDDSINNNTNMFSTNSSNANAPSGCYVMVKAQCQSGWTTDNLTVYDANGEQQITSGFECKASESLSWTDAFFTMQIPNPPGVSIDFGTAGGGD